MSTMVTFLVGDDTNSKNNSTKNNKNKFKNITKAITPTKTSQKNLSMFIWKPSNITKTDKDSNNPLDNKTNPN